MRGPGRGTESEVLAEGKKKKKNVNTERSVSLQGDWLSPGDAERTGNPQQDYLALSCCTGAGG